ncbi:MAG: lipopolysaccharide kinase InaA family protein, partial [Thermoanaerobaculia bacterium]
SWEVAQALAARGIDTPEPLAVGLVGGEGWYVARRLQDAEQIRRWFLRRDDASQPPPSLPYEFEEVVTALGRLARRLHDRGVFFRDFTDGNVLVTKGEAGPRLWLVDLDRARVGEQPVTAFRRWRDLARPGLNRPGDVKLLLSSYFHPEAVPRTAGLVVPGLRRRIVLWDAFKARVRPWRK